MNINYNINMNNFTTYFEESNKNKRVNKFNIHWQIVRTQAKAIKSVKDKIQHVLSFLEENPNHHNYVRVLNWLKTTGMAYPKGSPMKQTFHDTINDLSENIEDYINKLEDTDNGLSDISTEDLKMVLKDLSKRKYDFQFKKTPQDHIDFIKAVEEELEKRQ